MDSYYWLASYPTYAFVPRNLTVELASVSSEVVMEALIHLAGPVQASGVYVYAVSSDGRVNNLDTLAFSDTKFRPVVCLPANLTGTVDATAQTVTLDK